MYFRLSLFVLMEQILIIFNVSIFLIYEATTNILSLHKLNVFTTKVASFIFFNYLTINRHAHEHKEIIAVNCVAHQCFTASISFSHFEANQK